MTRRVAIVTGASRGLGAAIARALAAHGHAVAVNHRDSAEDADGVVRSIVEAGGEARAFAADITSSAGVAALVDDVEQQLGPVAIAVANATGPQPEISIEELRWEDVQQQLAYFVQSPTLLLQRLLPGMKARGYGRFVHIGSEVVDVVPHNMAAYTCAKAAQRSLARSWAKELGPHGITVNTVSPGWIPVERHDHIEETVFDAYRARVPLGRMGAPSDVADVVAFLCSDGADFVTGQDVAVNGGNTLG